MENVYKAPESELETQEQQDELDYAGFWVRVGASLIDTVVMVLFTFPLLYLAYGEQFVEPDRTTGLWDVLISYIFPAVAVILFWMYKSATPGKMVFGLKVMSLKGNGRLTVGQSVLRYIAYFPASLVLGLGLIWVAFDKKKQGWHDKIAKTVVIKKR